MGYNDLYIDENLDLKEKAATDKKVGHGVKFEKDESLNLDDCSINFGADY